MEKAPRAGYDTEPPRASGSPYDQPRGSNVTAPPSNGPGTVGFVLALLGLLSCWIPLVGWPLWLLGLIFSAIGLKKQPKRLAKAGMVISLGAFITLAADVAMFVCVVIFQLVIDSFVSCFSSR